MGSSHHYSSVDIQLWLDNLAYEHDLLSPVERELVEPYLNKVIHLNKSLLGKERSGSA